MFEIDGVMRDSTASDLIFKVEQGRIGIKILKVAG